MAAHDISTGRGDSAAVSQIHTYNIIREPTKLILSIIHVSYINTCGKKYSH